MPAFLNNETRPTGTHTVDLAHDDRAKRASFGTVEAIMPTMMGFAGRRIT
jgi:hypothetical protein